MKEKKNGYQTRMIIILFFAFGLVFMDRFSFTFILDFIIKDLNMNYTDGGLVVGVLSLFFGLSTLIFSGLSDLMGKKKPWLVAFILLFSVATLMAGFVSSVATMIFVRALMGITEGPVIPLVQSTVITESTKEHRGRNLGLTKSSGPLLSGVLAPIILIPIAVTWGWRWAFYSLSIPGIIIAIIVWKYIREPKSVQNDDDDKPTLKDMMGIIKHRNIWLIMLISIFYMLNMSSFMAFLATFAQDQTGVGLGLSATQRSFLFSVYGVGCFFWFSAVPWISDKIGRKPTLMFFGLLSCLFPMFIGYTHPSYYVLLVMTFILSFSMGYQPLFDSVIPAESVDHKYIATAMALIVLAGRSYWWYFRSHNLWYLCGYL